LAGVGVVTPKPGPRAENGVRCVPAQGYGRGMVKKGDSPTAKRLFGILTSL